VITNFGGTSAAAPVVSGLAGWALSVDPDLSAEALHAMLLGTAVPSPLVVPDASGHDDYYGYGLLSATGMLAELTEAGADTEKNLEEPAACACAATESGPWQAAQAIIVALTGLLAMRRRTARNR
jgi:serine protease